MNTLPKIIDKVTLNTNLELTISKSDFKIPDIGFKLFTNGGCSLNLGYPKNQPTDHSTAVKMSLLPFTGTAGFYLASKPKEERQSNEE